VRGFVGSRKWHPIYHMAKRQDSMLMWQLVVTPFNGLATLDYCCYSDGFALNAALEGVPCKQLRGNE